MLQDDADANEPMDVEEGVFTAAHLRMLSGITYRQLNEWERLGVLPGDRNEPGSWRKFGPREAFIVMVCMEIRARFGVPVASLRWLSEFMRKPSADHLSSAVRMMEHGLAVFLLTDLTSTFIMDADFQFEDLIFFSYFRHEDPEGYIFLKLNPLVNRLLPFTNKPEPLRIGEEIYTALRQANGQVLPKKDEAELLKDIRSGNFERVTAHLKNGRIVQVDGESTRRIEHGQELGRLLDEHEYQTITVQQHGGKIVRLVQKTVRKTGEPPRRGAPQGGKRP